MHVYLGRKFQDSRKIVKSVRQWRGGGVFLTPPPQLKLKP